MIFTIPNLISLIRIAAVPVFLWLLFGRDDPAAAGWLLGGLGATDWVDGWLARKLNQVSELGKILDPVGDRLAVAAAVVGGWISGVLPWWIALALIIRETLIALAAFVVASRSGKAIDVRLFGKGATMALYFAIPNFFIYAGTGHLLFGVVAWVFVAPGLVFYYVVLIYYYGDARRILAEASSVSSE